jgi:hypothetical protein
VIIRRRPGSPHAAPPAGYGRTGTRARGRFGVLAAAVPIGLVASGTLVWSSSHAAFVDTTDNPGNSWGTGVVQLGNDRTSTALFTTASEGPLVPGSSGYKCITVTYTGNVDTADTGVRLYGALTTGSAELADALRITVETSATSLATPPDADCRPTFDASPITHATRALSAFPTDYGTGIGDANGDGLGDWRPTATTDRARTYRISYSLPAGPHPSSLQGKEVGMTFTWEVRSDDTPGA